MINKNKMLLLLFINFNLKIKYINSVLDQESRYLAAPADNHPGSDASRVMKGRSDTSRDESSDESWLRDLSPVVCTLLPIPWSSLPPAGNTQGTCRKARGGYLKDRGIVKDRGGVKIW